MHKVRVDCVGLFPQYLAFCDTRFCRDLRHDLGREQREELPEFVRENERRMIDLAAALYEEFGQRVEVRFVLNTTPTGLWLSLRHRLGNKDVYAVVDGRKVVATGEGYAAVRRAVAAELQTA